MRPAMKDNRILKFAIIGLLFGIGGFLVGWYGVPKFIEKQFDKVWIEIQQADYDLFLFFGVLIYAIAVDHCWAVLSLPALATLVLGSNPD